MLDGGPSRTAQAAQRRAMQRAEPARRQPEAAPAPEPTPVDRAPEPRYAPAPRQRPAGGNRLLLALVAVLGVVLVGLVGWYMVSQSQGVASLVDEDKYQAVFFTNGQVYFGKLAAASSEYYTLTDVFYIQSDTTGEGEDETAGAEATTEQKLIKRGAEVYGPEDPMVIDRSQVLFFENITSDSEVAQLIRDYTSGSE